MTKIFLADVRTSVRTQNKSEAEKYITPRSAILINREGTGKENYSSWREVGIFAYFNVSCGPKTFKTKEKFTFFTVIYILLTGTEFPHIE